MTWRAPTRASGHWACQWKILCAIFQPASVFTSVNASDMWTSDPANLPDQRSTSRRTTAMVSMISTPAKRGLDVGSGAVAIDPVVELLDGAAYGSATRH